MSSPFATADGLPKLLELANLLWAELCAFGVVAPEIDDAADARATSGVEEYLVGRQAMALVVLRTLEQEGQLRLVERAPYRLGVGDWQPGRALAGYTAGPDGMLATDVAGSLLVNWRMDLAGDEAGTFNRVFRSMVWVAAHESVTGAIGYGFDLLEGGRTLSPRAVALACVVVLRTRSETQSDADAAARLVGRRRGARPEDWLTLRPARRLFRDARLSPEMSALMMQQVERVLIAVERARASKSLDAFVLNLCAAHKVVQAFRYMIKLTNVDVPIALRSFVSQLDEIDADFPPVLINLEWGTFRGVLDYARPIADAYRETLGDQWEQRFWSERLLLPRACGDLHAERVLSDWVLPSWRIAQPWAVWHTFDSDAALVPNRYADGRAPSSDEILAGAPSPEARRAELERRLRAARDVAGRSPKDADELFASLLAEYPWADAAWYERATAALAAERDEIAWKHLSAAIVLRPYEHRYWEFLTEVLRIRGSLEEARIASLIEARLRDLPDPAAVAAKLRADDGAAGTSADA